MKKIRGICEICEGRSLCVLWQKLGDILIEHKGSAIIVVNCDERDELGAKRYNPVKERY